MLILASAFAADPDLGTGQHGTFVATGPTLGPTYAVAMTAGTSKTFNLSFVLGSDGNATATLAMVMVYPNLSQAVKECAQEGVGTATCPAWTFTAPADGTYTFNVRYLNSSSNRSTVNWEVKVDH